MISSVKIGLVFILGILLGYGLYAISDKVDCNLDKNKINECIEQANTLLDIVYTKEYCQDKFDNMGFAFNFSMNHNMGVLE